jgi:hypothetical protein
MTFMPSFPPLLPSSTLNLTEASKTKHICQRYINFLSKCCRMERNTIKIAKCNKTYEVYSINKVL